MSDFVARLNAALEGCYAIERELGEGGMATVYVAEDIKHDRKVALKVLKPELAAVVGAERFLAEIKTTANLQHPHILPLFDSGEADSFLFYVMPYIEGETLRDRIDREKQLPVDEAVRIATAVAGALQTAHEQGIIHRDIKPANILLSRGEPLIADFGIALAVGAAGGSRLTETGLSMGTPYYMSPEQATGDQHVGPSTDTYALGAVLYEMLTGDPPYMGSTAQAVLGQIIAGETASATKKRASVPENVDAALRCALEKLPADRFTSARDFVRALGDEHFRHGEGTAVGAGARSGLWNWLTTTLAATTVVFATTTLLSFLSREPPEPVTRFSVRIPEEQAINPDFPDLDLSRDGSLLVYVGAGDAEQQRLWLRRWDELEAAPIPDTESALRPSISPDGQEVAFRAVGLIRVVPLLGGGGRTLTDSVSCCPTWSPDGAWVYYTNLAGGLSRVPAAGGTPEIVTRVDTAAGDVRHRYPDILPNGMSAVFEVSRGGNADPRIHAVDVESGEIRDLIPGRAPIYSVTGHLLFQDATEATLLAASFDAEQREITGAALPVADGLIAGGTEVGAASYAVSQTGGLVYLASNSEGLVTPVWVDQEGTAREIDPTWRARGNTVYSRPSLSPDGTRLAISIPTTDGGTTDLWIKQLDTGPLSRLTFASGLNSSAEWSPQGGALTFVSNRAGGNDLWSTQADGSSTAELLLDRELDIYEAFYSSDGQWLVFREGGVGAGLGDLYAMRPGMDGPPVPLAATEFQEYSPALSPDDRWLAYVSNASGRAEVYVRLFPDATSPRWQVSTAGGQAPVWAHGGRELFYRNGANELVSVEVTGSPTDPLGQQEVLFSMADYISSNGHPQYDVSPDDQRIVMLRIDEGESATELILVDNWAEELREQVGN